MVSLVSPFELKDKINLLLNTKRPVIVVGPTGSGKTYSVYEVAKSRGYTVVEVNPNTPKEVVEGVVEAIGHKALFPVLYLFDDVDKFESLDAIDTMKVDNFVVMTANSLPKLSQKMLTLCNVINVRKAYMNEVVSLLSQRIKNGKVNISGLSEDLRSVEAVLKGGEGYKKRNIKDDVNSFIEGNREKDVENMDVWVMDNATRCWWGIDVYRAIEVACLSDFYSNKKLMRALPKGHGIAEFPRYWVAGRQGRKTTRATGWGDGSI